MLKSGMDKKLVLPTAGLLVVAITSEAVLHHHEPEPHVEPPAIIVPTILPPFPTDMKITQIS
jgi:hypothetical protein